MNNNTKKELEELKQALGVMAESSLIFFRDVLQSGGTLEEAMKLTQVYMQAMLRGGNGGND